MENQKSACVLVKKGNLYLSVSRKDNVNDVGLPGGKEESCDLDLIDTATREALEETGFMIAAYSNVEPFIKDNCSTYLGAIINNRGPVFTREEGIVQFVTREILEKSISFSEYNQEMFLHFDNLNKENK